MYTMWSFRRRIRDMPQRRRHEGMSQMDIQIAQQDFLVTISQLLLAAVAVPAGLMKSILDIISSRCSFSLQCVSAFDAISHHCP